MISDYFQNQIQYIPELTEKILERVEFKTVWSGKRMQSGDKVLFAYVYQKGTDNLKYITFLERELNELDNHFNFVRLDDDILPVLAFKDDTINR
jgi:hypothetical protein